jgi:hypothetical protein
MKLITLYDFASVGVGVLVSSSIIVYWDASMFDACGLQCIDYSKKSLFVAKGSNHLLGKV